MRLLIVIALCAAAGCAQHTISPLPVAPGIPLRHDAAPADSFKSLYSFKGNPDGQNPYAGLANLGGTLYGTTLYGGKNQFGVLFKVSTTGAERVLHTFGGGSQNDGAEPYGTMIVLNGSLYGTTYYGGRAPADHGAVFKASAAGTENIVCSFTSSQGEFPYTGVFALNGTLYGTTHQGGAHGYGSAYACTTAGKVRVLHSFALSPDGAYPYDPPAALNGTLYGTTSSGGAYGQGTVFKVTTSGNEAVLHSFSGVAPDGSDPIGGLVNLNGELYGTTYYGGSHGDGIVFKIAP